MTTYAPNPFQGAPTGALPGQSAQAGALRSYAPNPFAGTNSGSVGKMAPHLSVAAADRPFASEISQLQGAGFKLPDLDAAWRQSPNQYEFQVSQLLRGPNASMQMLVLDAQRQDEEERRRAEANRKPAYEGE